MSACRSIDLGSIKYYGLWNWIRTLRIQVVLINDKTNHSETPQSPLAGHVGKDLDHGQLFSMLYLFLLIPLRKS